MYRHPPKFTRTDTPFPDTTLFRSDEARADRADRREHAGGDPGADRPLVREDRLQRGGGAGARRPGDPADRRCRRSEEHTSELQSLMRISYAVLCLKKQLLNRETPSLQSHAKTTQVIPTPITH